MFGIPWLSPLMLGAAGIAIAASLAGGFVVHKWDAASYAKLELSKATLRSEYSDYKARVAEDTDKATAAAAAKQMALQASNDALQAQLAATQRTANAQSEELKKILASAKPGDIRPLGPSALAYFERLRQQAGTGRTAPPENR